MIRRWPPPTYETEMEVGLPHQREFTIACVVLKMYEVGQGKSKKIAKRQAAHKMWLTLQQCPVDGAADGGGNEEEVNQKPECLCLLSAVARPNSNVQRRNCPIVSV